MAFAPIPMPGTGFEGLNQGVDLMDKLLMASVRKRKLEAEAKRQEALSQLPFGGTQLPGAAGQALALEMMKMQYGENSPQYKEAKEAYDLDKESTRSRIGYQNILSESAPKRFSTGTGKTAQEFEDIKKGFLPGTKIPLTPEQKRYYEGLYGLEMVKKTTDTDTRKRNLLATNVEKTIAQINPDDLVQFSGIKGMKNLAKEKAKDIAGNPSEKYLAYQQAITNADLLAKQIRQFYGDSIQPQMTAKLEKLTNPADWLKSPKTALANYNSLIKTLNSEMNTYRQGLKSPGIFYGNEENLEDMIERPMSPLEKKVGGRLDQNEGREIDPLEKMAEEAIAQGANPEMVKKRMDELRNQQNAL